MASDKTCEKLITRKVLCFPASKLDALDSILDALDSSLDTRSFRVSRIEDRVAKFEFRGTVNLHLHGTVPDLIQLHPVQLHVFYSRPIWINKNTN